jgi:hypothetical protein
MSHEPMHRVIRLKRYEQPPEGYFNDFLREFHIRQRAELLRPSLTALFLERFQGILGEIRVPAMAYAGATALAVVASIAILGLPRHSETPRAFAASYPSFQQAPVTIPKMQPVSLRVDTASDPSASAFPPSYILNARPANHESPLSF